MPPENLPKHAKEIFVAAEAAARTGTCKDSGDRKDECAARVAWSAVKKKFRKTADGKWIPKAETFSLVIQKASFDKVTQQRRWIAVASDTEEDSRKDSMTLELFNDFVRRIDNKEVPPEEFNVTSDYWSGGMPYLSLSHLLDLDGKGVPGPIDAVFVDGNKFKSKGRFNDTPLGRACFNAVCNDLYGDADAISGDKVRISIAFLDYKHRHKSSGYMFEGKTTSDICPECIADTIKIMIGQDEEVKGREFLKGHLIHEALTRVPVNNRTSMEVLSMTVTTQKEDIASIVGDEQAEELEKLATQQVQSESLVIKAKAKHDDDEEEEEDEEESSPKKKRQKSETVDSEAVLDTVFEELKELKSLITETHPLDEAITTLKAEYIEAIALDLTADEKLQLIQKSYAELGDIIQTGVADVPTTPGSDAQVLANAISKAFLPISEKLDLLLTQAASPQSTAQVPVRRSYQPTISDSLIRKDAETKSITPNLRKLIEKTV